MSDGSMYSKSSGMSRQTTRAFFRWVLNFEDSLLRCAFSITKMISAHSNNSGVTGFSASLFSPADAHSNSDQDENTCSAVGLRSLFWLQMKSTFLMRTSPSGIAKSSNWTVCRNACNWPGAFRGQSICRSWMKWAPSVTCSGLTPS